MSSTKQVFVYAVETEDAIDEHQGTGFHIESGHLVIEDNGASVAAFAPGRWWDVARRPLAVSELAAEAGRVVAEAADELFGQLGINTKEN